MLTTYYGDCPLITTTPAMEHKSPAAHPAHRGGLPSCSANWNSFRRSCLRRPNRDARRQARHWPLKARILLFEASPLLNPGHDDQKWRDAADAARAVMDCDSDYELFTAPGQIGSAYRNLFLESGENSSECIFSVQCMNQNKLGLSFELIARQYGTMAPLRDLIDFYCDRDGNARTPGEQRLDPSKIDPRFGATIVYPGCKFMGSTVTATQFQQTGCTIKKYTVYDEHTPTAAEKKHRRHRIAYRLHDPALRRHPADVRRSQKRIERAGRDGMERNGAPDPHPAGFTAESALEFPGKDQEKLRAVIRYERRAEFVGEGYYYNDLRRWREAENVNNGPIRKFNNDVILVRSFEPLARLLVAGSAGRNRLEPQPAAQ